MKQIISVLEPCSFAGVSALSVQIPQDPLTTTAPSVQNPCSQSNGLSGAAAGVVFGGLGSKLGIR